MSSSTLRVVSKTQYDQQTFLDINPSALDPLKPNSVRIRTFSVGLTANNLAYCMGGEVLKWWYTYPVPSLAPAPYSDTTKYGVSPGWGYATILESNIPELAPSSALYGFWPLSTLPVDLQLAPSPNVNGHWFETSPHRQQLMPLYNRYFEAEHTFVKEPVDTLGAFHSVIRPVWGCGYMLNRFTFAWDDRVKPLHPNPDANLPWSEQDADLTSAMVIALGAGSKTSRSFVHQLATNRKAKLPKVLIEVTQGEGSASFIDKFPFEHKVVSYADLLSPTTIEWIAKEDVSRVVILNFAGREGAVEKLADALQGADLKKPMLSVAVGGEAKVYSRDEVLARMATAKKLNSVQCNTSGLYEAAFKLVGEEALYHQKHAAFDEVVRSQLARGQNRVLGIELKIGHGLKGADGLEAGWKVVAEGKLKGDEGLLYVL